MEISFKKPMMVFKQTDNGHTQQMSEWQLQILFVCKYKFSLSLCIHLSLHPDRSIHFQELISIIIFFIYLFSFFLPSCYLTLTTYFILR
jgi:hypothetical protein